MFKKFFGKLGKNDKKKEKEKLNKELDNEIYEEIIDDNNKENELENNYEIEEVNNDEVENNDNYLEGDKEKLEEIDKEVETETEVKNVGFFGKLLKGLEKTRKGISQQIDNVIKSYQKIDEELFEDLEEVLITADIGVNTTMRVIEGLKDKVKERKITDAIEIKSLLKEELVKILNEGDNSKLNIEPSPSIILVVGVNGVGKTTTIGKLSNRLKDEGKKVLIAAGDTFRAAAIEQLTEWSNRSGVEIVAHTEGADPAAVIFDGIQAAKSRNVDVLICDTAGRLHNKKNLMNELNKIFRIVEREYPDATKEVLLVVDATTGQNAVFQAKTFKEACNITGIALTKLDGTAKGGVVLAVQSELNVPVKLVGVGEGINDLQDFDAQNFVNAILD